MAKRIRVGNMELQAKLYLPKKQFKDYEDLEERSATLTPIEKRYYALLQQWAMLSHVLSLKQFDKILK